MNPYLYLYKNNLLLISARICSTRKQKYTMSCYAVFALKIFFHVLGDVCLRHYNEVIRNLSMYLIWVVAGLVQMKKYKIPQACDYYFLSMCHLCCEGSNEGRGERKACPFRLLEQPWRKWTEDVTDQPSTVSASSSKSVQTNGHLISSLC